MYVLLRILLGQSTHVVYFYKETFINTNLNQSNPGKMVKSKKKALKQPTKNGENGMKTDLIRTIEETDEIKDLSEDSDAEVEVFII